MLLFINLNFIIFVIIKLKQFIIIIKYILKYCYVFTNHHHFFSGITIKMISFSFVTIPIIIFFSASKSHADISIGGDPNITKLGYGIIKFFYKFIKILYRKVFFQ